MRALPAASSDHNGKRNSAVARPRISQSHLLTVESGWPINFDLRLPIIRSTAQAVHGTSAATAAQAHTIQPSGGPKAR